MARAGGIAALALAFLPGPAVLRATEPRADPRPITLASLRAGHPRLVATADRFAAIIREISVPGSPARWYESIRASADRLLDAPPSTYEIPDGKRLLRMSRQVAARTDLLALVWRLEAARGHPDAGRYRDRLWRELETAASFPDWNPSHFLDTAEMTRAFAIGLDWAWDGWTPAQRRALAAAIRQRGLEPGWRRSSATRGGAARRSTGARFASAASRWAPSRSPTRSPHSRKRSSRWPWSACRSRPSRRTSSGNVSAATGSSRATGMSRSRIRTDLPALGERSSSLRRFFNSATVTVFMKPD